jgi:hypothetical protein
LEETATAFIVIIVVEELRVDQSVHTACDEDNDDYD